MLEQEFHVCQTFQFFSIDSVVPCRFWILLPCRISLGSAGWEPRCVDQSRQFLHVVTQYTAHIVSYNIIYLHTMLSVVVMVVGYLKLPTKPSSNHHLNHHDPIPQKLPSKHQWTCERRPRCRGKRKRLGSVYARFVELTMTSSDFCSPVLLDVELAKQQAEMRRQQEQQAAALQADRESNAANNAPCRIVCKCEDTDTWTHLRGPALWELLCQVSAVSTGWNTSNICEPKNHETHRLFWIVFLQGCGNATVPHNGTVMAHNRLHFVYQKVQDVNQ